MLKANGLHRSRRPKPQPRLGKISGSREFNCRLYMDPTGFDKALTG